MSDLDKLIDPRNREALLLAEVAAWLHDVGKFSNKFIESHSISSSSTWHHELVLKRNTRELERILGRELSDEKSDHIELVGKILKTHIPESGKGKEFPNPNKGGFVTKLDTYLLNLKNKKLIPEISDITLVKTKYSKYPLEKAIDRDFFPHDFYDFAESSNFTIQDQHACIADFIEQHGDPVEAKSDLVRLFKPPFCDGIDSAFDKGNVENDSKQGHDPFISNAFGFEFKKIMGQDEARKLLTKSSVILIGDRRSRKKELAKNFSHALGETRRPSNDVTLWDHSYSTGVLYRTLLGYVLLKDLELSSLIQDIQEPWRLLDIRTDCLHYLSLASCIPDLMARKTLLDGAFDRVQKLLGEKYPLALEVYRDENRIAFVVPNIENLLELTDNGRKLSELILCDFDSDEGDINTTSKVEGEIVPMVGPLSESWDGRVKQPPLGKILSEEIVYLSNYIEISKTWEPRRASAGEASLKSIEQICTICGLRPQGYGAHDRSEHYHLKTLKKNCPENCQTCKAIKRSVCSICEQRRDDRSMRWAKDKLCTTIWIDEVTDPHGRLALIAGYFDLTRWLSGDLVRTMAVLNPANANIRESEKVAKNPSLARLRRIWETTRGFWQEVCPTYETRNLQESLVGHAVALAGPRLEIRGTLQQKDGAKTPGPYHAYDLVLPKGIKLSVTWDPEEEKNDHPKGRFISIDNLIYFTSLAGNKAPSREKGESEEDYSLRLHKWAAEKSKELIQGTLPIEESTGYGGKAKNWGEIDVKNVVMISNSQYTPAIPILAEPRTFMALVPADKALKIVEDIKSKYEREMGKVRNRLPLHIGIVYAHRRTPLRAILDAGRRMLKQSAKPEGWKVACAARKLSDRNNHLPERFNENKEGQFKEWLEILLEKDGRRINWFVPAVMGDGQTLDHWYPFVFLNSSSEPVDTDRRFKALNPWTGSDGWLVHAADLNGGDIVYFTPATLDFQWLDSAGRRFEIAYNKQGQRRGLLRRPYLLDELETLNEIWQTLSNHLSKNQIYIMRDLIEAKRQEWQIDDQRPVDDNVFKEFCREALVNAEWKNGDLPWKAEGKDREAWLGKWADYAACGWISDVIELNLQIMKEEI